MRFFSYIFLLIIVLLGLSFALLNSQVVTLNYYIGQRNISLSLLLVLCLGFGIFLGLLFAVGPLIKLKRRNHQLKKQLKNSVQAEQE